jgi:hypothetical protein
MKAAGIRPGAVSQPLQGVSWSRNTSSKSRVPAREFFRRVSNTRFASRWTHRSRSASRGKSASHRLPAKGFCGRTCSMLSADCRWRCRQTTSRRASGAVAIESVSLCKCRHPKRYGQLFFSLPSTGYEPMISVLKISAADRSRFREFRTEKTRKADS